MTNLTIINRSAETMFRRVIKYILCFLSSITLFSCSDDLEIDRSLLNSWDDAQNIEFVFPVDEHVALTRNDGESERYVNKITLLFFDNTGALKGTNEVDNLNIENINRTINNTTRSCSVKVNLDDNLSFNDEVYAVANTQITGEKDLLSDLEETAGDTDKDKLFNLLSSTFYDKDQGRIMSGKKAGNIIPLTRVSAKITLKDAFQKEDTFKLLDYKDNGTYGGFSIYGSADKCYVMAPEKTPSYYADSRRNTEIRAEKLENNGIRYDAYALPTKTHEEIEVKTYIVIYAWFEGEECYYAVPLYDKEEKKFLNIEPNHWYEMTITEVLTKGADTPEEAIRSHNFNQIMVDIHDHANEILSMVSDGTHELGTSRQITFSDSEKSQALSIKCYSSDADDFDINKFKITITEGDEWFYIEKNTETKDGEFPFVYTQIEHPDKSYTEDMDNPGVQLTLTVKLKEGVDFYSDAFGKIEIYYRGLRREVYVYYNSEFKVSQICDAKLIITDNDDGSKNQTINDYWTFIKGYDKTDNPQSIEERLYGIRANKLVDEKLRTRGFHFPMPYGFDTKKRWTYEYEVDFSKILGDDNSISITKITYDFEPASDNFIKNNIKFQYIEGSKIKLSLAKSAQNSYTYAEGIIVLTITLSDGSEKEVTTGIYHTGFFHYEGDLEYVPSEDYGYYYYEVKPLAGDGDSKYWLDRNLGAKSNLRYIDNENVFENDLGDPEAAGRFYKISDNNKPLFADPTFNDFKEKICPPGYHIPQTQEWNAIRMSSNFMTLQEVVNNENIITSYFYTGSPKTGNVYFPKARYHQGINETSKYSNDANAGDTESGYYWTRTLAPGMEKENMGEWLRALYINGTSTSYNNANIEEHKLNVRCVAGNADNLQDQIDNYISLSVHHATHVYIFDKNSHASLHPFPGKAVGTSQSANKWQYFSTTTSVDINNLSMAFVYVSDKGEMTIYSRDGNSFSTNHSMSEILDDNENLAWDVQKYQYNYIDFCSEGAERPNNVLDSQPDCKDTGTSEGEYGTSRFNSGDIVTFKWPSSYNGVQYNRILAWYSINHGDNSYFAPDAGSWHGSYASVSGDWITYYKGSAIDFDAPRMDIILETNDTGKKLEMQVEYDSNAGKFVVKKAPEGGSVSVTYDENNSRYNWEIILFTDKGQSGGDTGGGGNSGGVDIDPNWHRYNLLEGDYDLPKDKKNDGIIIGDDYNWNNVKEGSIILINLNVWWQPECVIDICDTSTLEAMITLRPDASVGNNNTTLAFSLTNDMIDIMKGKGFLLKGLQGQIKKIDIALAI